MLDKKKYLIKICSNKICLTKLYSTKKKSTNNFNKNIFDKDENIRHKCVRQNCVLFTSMLSNFQIWYPSGARFLRLYKLHFRFFFSLEFHFSSEPSILQPNNNFSCKIKDTVCACG